MAVDEGFGHTRAVDAVHRALHHDLETAGGSDATRAHLLGVADVLLHRAVQDDLRDVRRNAAREDVAAFLARLPLEMTPKGGDPFENIEASSDWIAAGSPTKDLVKQVLRILVTADLPELGRATSPEREAAEVPAMDWLGREATAHVTPQDVADYISRRSPLEAVDVDSVTQLSGGFSKTTLLVGLHRAGHGPEEIVIRQVPPGRDAHTLTGEYNVVRFAWKHGVEAPEPLWLEPADNLLGGPFFASRRVPGSNVGDVFGPRPGTDPEASRGLARALAHLHQIPVVEVPDTPVSRMVAREEILEAISEQAELASVASAVDGSAPHPLHALLFAWLRAHAPQNVARPVLLHGDPGFHNMLVHEGKVQALLDWERARVGDPAQDLAYVRPHVTRVQPWQEFLDAYCAAGGEPPDDGLLRYYSVWHDAWRFTGSYRGRGRLLSQPSGLLAGVTGLLHAPRFLLSGLETAYEVEL